VLGGTCPAGRRYSFPEGAMPIPNADAQALIDSVRWYHEFDFGNGLRAAPPPGREANAHRRVWRFIHEHLDAIDFRGKSVLDVGAWDGYWSFDAEKRGAASVLAADDLSQNHSSGRGIFIAHELLGSSVEVRQDVSAYALGSLGRRFDVVLCLGVVYHLFDPFHALAQLRHCCHANTLVVIETEVSLGLRGPALLFEPQCGTRKLFPSVPALENLAKAAYLEVGARHYLDHPFGLRCLARRVLRGIRGGTRGLFVCKPFVGANNFHFYPPPFGLHIYDPRFVTGARRQVA
jgi:tRNA (mo5U34)-methyltransferase